MGYSFQPLFTPISLFHRLASGNGLGDDEVKKVSELRSIFRSIANLQKNEIEIFLFKLAKAEKPLVNTKRFPVNEILFLVNDSAE